MYDASHDEDNSNSTTNNSAKQAKNSFVDQFAETANNILDLAAWFNSRLNTRGGVFKVEEAKGTLAEVSLSIPAGGTGEVTVIMGQTRKNYPAKALRDGEEFQRGSKVRIADVAVSTMYVERV